MVGSLEGKVAIVTGAASGIGRAGAQLFAREGAKVVVTTGANVEGGQETVRLIRDAGGEATFVRCDVSKEDEVEAAVDACVRIYGRLDYAFNNAGVGPDGKRVPVLNIIDCTEEVWDRTLDVNLKGAFFCMKYEMRQMMKQESGGVIINTSSVGAWKPLPGFCAYSASKAGLGSLTRTAAQEGAPHKIRVNAVLPGPTQNTLLFEYLTGTTPGVKDDMEHAVPLGCIAYPEDMGEAVLWLCSEQARMVTGQSLAIDGGLTAC